MKHPSVGMQRFAVCQGYITIGRRFSGMPGEKYVVAASENAVQISIRNILNPVGYMYLSNCSDPVSLMRLVRSYIPDFIVVDWGMKSREMRQIIETIDDEMLCAVVMIGEDKDVDLENMMTNYRILSYCRKPLDKNILINTVEMSIFSYKRVFALEKKLREITENYESRKLIERAKWILMSRDSISEQDAYERMRKKSMNNRMAIREIAEAIIFTNDMNK